MEKDNNFQFLQALMQSQEALRRLCDAEAKAQKDYECVRVEADKWERRYQLALSAERKDLAGTAKFQRDRHKAIASRLESLIEQQAPQIAAIKHKIAYWRDRTSELQKRECDRQGAINAIFSQVDIVNMNDKSNDFDLDNDALARMKVELLNFSQEQVAEPENPEKVLEEAIKKTMHVLINATASERAIRQRYEQAKNEVKSWHQKIQFALQRDDNNLVFQALVNKTVQGEVASAFKAQSDQQVAVVKLLQENLTVMKKIKHLVEIESELSELKAQLSNSAKFSHITPMVSNEPSNECVATTKSEVSPQLHLVEPINTDGTNIKVEIIPQPHQVSCTISEMVDQRMAGETDEVKNETKFLIDVIKKRALAEGQNAGCLIRKTYLNAVRQARESIEGNELIKRDRIELVSQIIQEEAERNWQSIVMELSELGT